MRLYDRIRAAITAFKQGEPPYISDATVFDMSFGKLQPNNYTSLVKAYKGWVFACIRIIADAVARANLRLYAQKGDDVVEVTEHPFLDLLRNVNPYMNSRELRLITTIYLELTGNSYWYIPRNRLGIPAEIWVLPSHQITIIPDDQKFIGGYIYRVGMKEVRFEPDEIVHFKYPNPEDLYYGRSPLQAAAVFVDIDEFMGTYQLTLFKNQARPDGVLKTDAKLDRDTVELIRAEWNRLHRGVSKAGRIAILQGGLEYKPIGTTPRELDFVEGHRFVRNAVCHIFGVPPSKLGIVEDVNRANAEANDWTFQRETILPKLRLIEEKINEQILQLYDKRLFCRFDDPTPENWERVLRERETNIKLGITTINEERAKQGLDPVDWGHRPWLAINLMPAGSTTPPKKEHTEEVNTKDAQERREQIWKRYIAATEPIENNYTARLQMFFDDQRKQVLRNLRKLGKSKGYETKIDESDIDFILFPRGEADAQLGKLSTPFIYQAYKSGALLAISEVGIDIDVTMQNPKVQEYLRVKTFKIKQINDTTEKALRTTLLEGIRAGESVDKLADRIEAVFDFAHRYRSVRIARTEVIEASNQGQLRVYEDSGVVQLKEWITALDEHTCEECMEANGDTARLGEVFPTTGVEAPPHHPNCRCTIAPVIAE